MSRVGGLPRQTRGHLFMVQRAALHQTYLLMCRTNRTLAEKLTVPSELRIVSWARVNHLVGGRRSMGGPSPGHPGSRCGWVLLVPLRVGANMSTFYACVGGVQFFCCTCCSKLGKFRRTIINRLVLHCCTGTSITERGNDGGFERERDRLPTPHAV